MRCARFARRGGGVGDDLLEFGDVLEKSLAPALGQPAQRLRPIALVALPYLDKTRLLQQLNLPAEIAVRQRAQRLEIVEHESLRMRGQRRENAQARALVDHALELLVRE